MDRKSDDARIVAALPTVQQLLKNGEVVSWKPSGTSKGVADRSTA